MLKSYFLIGLFFWIGSLSLMAQSSKAPDFVEGDLLVQISPNYSILQVAKQLQFIGQKPTEIRAFRELSSHARIWQLKFNAENIDQQTMLEAIRQHPGVYIAQNNHILEYRNTVPDDTEYSSQWQYDNDGSNGGTVNADIDAPEAWDITTGGVTASGDTIVVCVIDDGLDPTHDDFGGNVWANTAEIPNNGIDDDGNGYTDDYAGWNVDEGNDNIAGGGFGGGWHGTPVAGIVGARGNNANGVAGVNWNVKLMIVVGGGQEADAIAAYDYPLTQRMKYNQTGGQEGAFVVATNASWGIDGLQAVDAPLWCAFYDTLGVQGILNAGATTNSNTNVDVDGDMPTQCGSDYMIAVTNLGRDGVKITSAGYGTTTIDLGAFGEDTYTAALGNTYGGFGGTSGATPHVAGAIALLYAAPCPKLAFLAKSDPAAAALQVREFILDGVVQNTSLQGITVTGGQLNLKNSLDEVLQWGCSVDGCHEPFALFSSAVSGDEATINWFGVGASTGDYEVQYKMEDDTSWTTVTATDTFITLTGLLACTNYDFQVAADCDTAMGDFSTLFSFKTGDCCYAPTTISEDAVGNTSADFSWNSDANVNGYQVEYRIEGGNNWNTITTSSNSLSLSGLESCTTYEMRIISSCAINVNNEYSTTIYFRTKGCGVCEDAVYCDALGNDASYEWIESIQLNDLDNTSGQDDGYGDFTGTSMTTTLQLDSTYIITFGAGRNGASSVNWRAWIDMDSSGTFETNELVAEVLNSDIDIETDTFTVPSNVTLGNTRLRIAMRYNTNPDACGSFSYGEVEDYCIVLEDNVSNIQELSKISTAKVFPNPFSNQISVEFYHQNVEETQLVITDVTGRIISNEIHTTQQGKNLISLNTNQLAKGVYLLSIHLPNQPIQAFKIIK